MENKKYECKHKFHSVYYGSEWEVECEKCDKNIRDIYSKEDANEIVNNKILKNENSQ
jgi:hypothetical protein